MLSHLLSQETLEKARFGAEEHECGSNTYCISDADEVSVWNF